jgi:O-antigen/teichoic acid export membrane protein
VASATLHGRLFGPSAILAGAFVISGVASYITLVVSKRSLSADGFGIFSIFWSLGFFLAALAHSPVEQELSRSVAVQLERRVAPSPDLRRAALALALATGVALALAAALLRLEVVGSGVPAGLLAAVGVLLTGEAVGSLVRAEASGRQETGVLASVVMAHGLARGVAATAAAVLGWDVVATSAAVAFAGVVPVLYIPRLVRRVDRPHGDAPPGGGPLEFSVASTVRLGVSTPPRSLFAIGMPVLAAIVATASEQATVGDLLAALSMTSAPVLIAAALQFILLPKYATWIERDDHARVGVMTRRMLRFVALGIAAATTLAAVLGTRALRLLFGATQGIGSLPLTLMTAGAGALFMANLLMPVVVATRRYQVINGAWYAGAVVTIATACLPIALPNAIGLASFFGPVAVVGLLLAALRPMLRMKTKPAPSPQT